RCGALVELARLDTKNPRWKDVGRDVVGPLLAAEPLHVAVWSAGLRDVKEHLLAQLAEVYRDRKRPAERRLATSVLRDYAADNPEWLVDCLPDADREQLPLLLLALKKSGERAVALLQQELDRKPQRDSEQARDALARRQANAAVALLRMGRAKRVWPLFVHSEYPDLRTHLLHRVGW